MLCRWRILQHLRRGDRVLPPVRRKSHAPIHGVNSPPNPRLNRHISHIKAFSSDTFTRARPITSMTLDRRSLNCTFEILIYQLTIQTASPRGEAVWIVSSHVGLSVVFLSRTLIGSLAIDERKFYCYGQCYMAIRHPIGVYLILKFRYS